MSQYKSNTERLIRECKRGFGALVRFHAVQYCPDCVGEPSLSSTSFLGGVIFFLISALAMLCPMSAQTNHASWKSLSELRTGLKIEVVDIGSKEHVGTLMSVSDSAITYQDHTGEHTIQKEEVQSVRVRENSSRLRNALIGVGAGAGAGAGITAAVWEDHGYLGGKGAGAAVGGAIGGVIGAIVGALSPSHHLVYRAVSH